MATTTSSSSSKPKGLSLHIGLNAVSPAAYGGWSGDLAACEFDAKDMAAIAASRGMKSTVLLTKKGTRAKTLAAMRKAAKALRKGDFFFLTYSGHGGQVPDVTGEEADKQDETWCLYDGQLIDDELYFELSRFAAGVRILVLSDSCHSGTVTRNMPPQFDPGREDDHPHPQRQFAREHEGQDQGGGAHHRDARRLARDRSRHGLPIGQGCRRADFAHRRSGR